MNGSNAQPAVSVVIPTRNRWAMVQEVLPSYLDDPSVSEVIVVDDASDEPAQPAVTADARVRVIRLDRQWGSATAKNVGVRAASGALTFIGEDDVEVVDNAISSCLAVLTAAAGPSFAMVTIASAPLPRRWVPQRFLLRGDAVLDRLGASAASSGPPPPDATRVSHGTTLSLGATQAYRELGYDPGFLGNAYREETDFWLRAAKSGFAVYRADEAVVIHHNHRLGGGNRSDPVRYEYWCLRNNLRLLRRHAPERANALQAAYIVDRIPTAASRIGRWLLAGRPR